MLATLINILANVGVISLAASAFFLRRTVLSMLDAGPVTHNIWHGISRRPWHRRVAFVFRAMANANLPGTADEGWTEVLKTRFRKEDVELFEEARRLGQVPPVYPLQVVAAARTVAWGWLCAFFALIAFIAQILTKVMTWLA